MGGRKVFPLSPDWAETGFFHGEKEYLVVDEDEEAVNLVKFQNGYNLASKMIQTLTEIYDKLILETGV